MSGNNIKVVCRFRPQNQREIAEGGEPIVTFDDNGESLDFQGEEYKGGFTFDRVFGSGTAQEEIFDYAAKTTVQDVLNGYNGTVIAYGQTGSGKTFTMMGANIDNPELKGLIPRLTEQIFNCIIGAPEHCEFTVKVSYMEIYMERIKDLLNPTNDNLPIHEEKNRGVYVKGLIEVYVGSVAEVFEVMRRGGQSRVVAFTNMNAESSRSHSIFVITVNQKNLKDGTNKTGRLFLVDLAGSEKVGKTGASGQTLEEAKKINKSLTTLGMVINSLTDGKSTYIPYRDSKLTRILQESLGGNSRTTLIINASPSSFNEAETLGTLRFGMRAKNIKNKAKVNAELSPLELKNLLKKVEAKTVSFKQFIALLERELGVWRGGGSVPKEDQVTYEKFLSGGKSLPAITTAKEAAVAPPSPALTASDAPSRASTPTPNDKSSFEEEKEKFIQRENDLMDEVSQKSKELERQKAVALSLNEEAEMLRAKEAELSDESKSLAKELNEAKLSLEKASFENKEAQITLDGMKEANRELGEQLEQMKEFVKELESAETAPDREKQKQQRLNSMLANLNASGVVPQDGETPVNPESGSRPPANGAASNGMATPSSETTISSDVQVKMQEDMQNSIQQLNEANMRLTKAKYDLEKRLQQMEVEYEELLDKTIAEEENVSDQFNDIRSKLESQFGMRKSHMEREIESLKKELEMKNNELVTTSMSISDLRDSNNELRMALNDMKRDAQTYITRLEDSGRPETEKDKELARLKKAMAHQQVDFDTMRRGLMRDVQSRCEKVVELEMALDETKQRLANMEKNNNVRATQKKMAFLERNLESLTSVQKDIVEQNTQLKKELTVVGRKMATRAERIQALEDMLSQSQTKMEVQRQNHEAQMKQLQSKLQEARAAAGGGSSEWAWGRVARPLRGGGAPIHVVDEDDIPPDQAGDKRTSWFSVSGLLGGGTARR